VPAANTPMGILLLAAAAGLLIAIWLWGAVIW
jgi:hypothetical protein